VLDIPLYQAVGMLELLWHLTAREAPRGDIGKLSNEDIALALDYRGDEDVLIEALIRTRWLDRNETHRLLIHDWHEHAWLTINSRALRHVFSNRLTRSFPASSNSPSVSNAITASISCSMGRLLSFSVIGFSPRRCRGASICCSLLSSFILSRLSLRQPKLQFFRAFEQVIDPIGVQLVTVVFAVVKLACAQGIDGNAHELFGLVHIASDHLETVLQSRHADVAPFRCERIQPRVAICRFEVISEQTSLRRQGVMMRIFLIKR
jgi:hypothetical protein